MGGELRGLRALVTGASKGIGYSVATRLRDEGATVLGTARTALPGLPKDLHFVAADVTSVDGFNRQPTPTKFPMKNGPGIVDFRPVL
jgi:NAD(P)-dependent dehydrogenase (short-subunit alcohol dehydrogenase family)